MFTKRNIVKSVKDYMIWNAATAVAITAVNTVVDEPTETQEAGIELGSTAAGYVVMRALKARTDQVIDSALDWRTNRKVAETLPNV